MVEQFAATKTQNAEASHASTCIAAVPICPGRLRASPATPTCAAAAPSGSRPASQEEHTPRRRRLKGVAQSTMATASWACRGCAARLEAMLK
jgi:hypothetical protein